VCIVSVEHPEIPSKFGPALRWFVSFVLIAVLVYGASESFRGGKTHMGGVYSGLAVLALIIAIKWNEIPLLARSLSVFAVRNKVVLSSLLGTAALIVAAFYVGRVVGQKEATTPPAIGNVVWNFEQTARGAGYFLNLQQVQGQEMRVTGFGAHGHNISSAPIEYFSGYLRSDLTNIQLPLLLLAQDPDEAKLKICLAHPWIPTLPQETFGIPAFADFDIATFENAITLPGVDGMPLSKFLNDFVPFTIFLDYDGTKFERHFTKAEVLNQVATLEKSVNPSSIPRVMRRPNAKTPVVPSLQTLLPPDPPTKPPGLSYPLPPAPLPKPSAN
jgi:hypothetical protein